MDIIYYDSEEFEKGLCSDAFVMKNMKPIPAGTSIFPCQIPKRIENGNHLLISMTYILFLRMTPQRLTFILFHNFILWQPIAMVV